MYTNLTNLHDDHRMQVLSFCTDIDIDTDTDTDTDTEIHTTPTHLHDNH